MLVEYEIPPEQVFVIEGLPPPRYFVLLGRETANIEARENEGKPFYVVPVGDFRGIYNHQ